MSEEGTADLAQRKLSVKVIMQPQAITKALIPEGEKEIALCRIWGRASSTKSGHSQFGDWTAFLGDFKAVNYLTGEKFASNKVLLPKLCEEQVMAKLASMGPEARGVEFAYEIGIAIDKDPRSGRGYQYVTKSLTKITGADPLATMEADMPPLPKMKRAAAG